MWRLLDKPIDAPLIFYSPQILGWSGAKLFKSMYVSEGAYECLRNGRLAYLLDLEKLFAAERAMEGFYEEITS